MKKILICMVIFLVGCDDNNMFTFKPTVYSNQINIYDVNNTLKYQVFGTCIQKKDIRYSENIVLICEEDENNPKQELVFEHGAKTIIHTIEPTPLKVIKY